MTDTHCHLFDPAFNADRENVIENARKSGVLRLVQVGTSVEESRLAAELANQHDDMVATVGIHPHEAEQYGDPSTPPLAKGRLGGVKLQEDIHALKKIAQENKKIVAVGECGLDYGRIINHEPGIMDPEKLKRMQKELFAAQIKLAEELKLPFIIHCRDAHKEVAQILQTTHYSLPTIIHCFTGTWEDAQAYLAIGCYISFSGIVTFEKRTHGIVEAAKNIPLNRMLVETDAPYLAPAPLRGNRNEPAFIKHTVEYLAKLRGISFEELEQATDENAKRALNIPLR